MVTLCSQCSSPISCKPEGGCWCAEYPNRLRVPEKGVGGCVCPNCLQKRLQLHAILPGITRIESCFPLPSVDSPSVLLVSPQNSALGPSTPPLDLLKISTFLRKRGYATRLCRGVIDADWPEPRAVIFTTVFSWEIPWLRRMIASVRTSWSGARRILSGVLPRTRGGTIENEFDVDVLDESSETILDNEPPDYSLIPDWDASILITSRGVCPRECGHCETAARGKGIARLNQNWPLQLNLGLPRVEVWDNTLMLTPREHFCGVTLRLRETAKPVDFVCGISPSGVEETELHWRIEQMSGIPMNHVRLECNQMDEMPRFVRLLDHVQTIFGKDPLYRSFAVVNGVEAPKTAMQRISTLKAAGIKVDVISFTPHDWESSNVYVNSRRGWTRTDIESSYRLADA